MLQPRQQNAGQVAFEDKTLLPQCAHVTRGAELCTGQNLWTIVASMSVLAVLIASLLGSPHCAGMCGGFVALSSGQGERPVARQTLYHLGRLTTYVLLGGLAAYLGGQFDVAGEIVGVQHAAAVLVGVLLMWWGLQGFFPILKLSLIVPWTGAVDAARLRFHQALSHWAERYGKGTFAYCLGLSSTLLPCGWLYAYVAVAAAAETPSSGMLLMSAFWLGTLPVLITIGSLSHLIANPLRPYIPRVVAILMIAAGLFSLAGHLAPHDHHGMHNKTQHHHEDSRAHSAPTPQ